MLPRLHVGLKPVSEFDTLTGDVRLRLGVAAVECIRGAEECSRSRSLFFTWELRVHSQPQDRFNVSRSMRDSI